VGCVTHRPKRGVLSRRTNKTTAALCVGMKLSGKVKRQPLWLLSFYSLISVSLKSFGGLVEMRIPLVALSRLREFLPLSLVDIWRCQLAIASVILRSTGEITILFLGFFQNSNTFY